jgi:hypothetical protein
VDPRLKNGIKVLTAETEWLLSVSVRGFRGNEPQREAYTATQSKEDPNATARSHPEETTIRSVQ